MLLPTNIATGRVTGQFIAGVVDGVDDDQDPDAVPAAGFVTFTASVPYLPDPTASPNPATILTTSVVAVLDNEGYLCTPAQGTLEPSYRGVRLIATDDPDLSVEGWTWNATYSFSTVAGQKLAIPTHSFAVPSDGVVDLTTAVKVPSSTGIGTEQAEALAASAQAAAIQSAQDAATAAQAAVDAAGAAQVTDANISALVGNPATDTADAVTALVVTAAADKLNVDDAINTYQSRAALDAAAAAKVSTGGTATNTAVKAIADASADTASGPKIPTSQKGAANGVATLDDTSNVPTAQLGAVAGIIAAQSPVVMAAAPNGTDDTTTLNTLIAANPGKTIRLRPGLTYKITDTLTVPSGTTIDGAGATIDATGLPTGSAFGQIVGIVAQGTVASSVAITDPIAQWSRVITGIASTTGLAAGDLVFVYNQEQPVPGMTRTDRDKGEIRTILTVDSSTQLTFVSGSTFAYGASGIGLQKITPAENVKLRGFSLKLGGVGKGHNGIRISYGRNVAVENVSIDGAEDVAVSLNTVTNGRVAGCSIRNSTNPSFTTSGYGVNVTDGSQHVIVDANNFYNCRHFVAGGGKWPTIYVDITGNHGEKSINGAYDCHEPAHYWTFRGNTGINCYGGFLIRGQYITVESNYIAEAAGKAYEVVTVDLVTEQRGIRIINNRAVNAALAGIWVDGKAAGGEPDSLKIDVEIRGNVLRNCGPDAILVRHFDGAIVAANSINAPSRHGILALGTASGTPSKRLTLDNNTISSPGGDGIQAQFVDDINGAGGTVTSPALYGYNFATCNRTRLTGVTVRNPVQSGIYLNGGAVHTVTGGTVTGGTSGSYDALRGSGASDVTVNGGYYAGPRAGVATTTGDRVIIIGVNATGAVAATKISSDATSKVLANNLP